MHPNENALHDYVDGSGDASERSTIEQHLAACATCRQLVDDLREIKRSVATLEHRDPPVRVWSRIERAIKLEQEHAAAATGRGARGLPLGQAGRSAGRVGALTTGRALKALPWLAAAAALVVATVVGLRMIPGRTPSRSQGE